MKFNCIALTVLVVLMMSVSSVLASPKTFEIYEGDRLVARMQGCALEGDQSTARLKCQTVTLVPSPKPTKMATVATTRNIAPRPTKLRTDDVIE